MPRILYKFLLLRVLVQIMQLLVEVLILEKIVIVITGMIKPWMVVLNGDVLRGAEVSCSSFR